MLLYVILFYLFYFMLINLFFIRILFVAQVIMQSNPIGYRFRSVTVANFLGEVRLAALEPSYIRTKIPPMIRPEC